MAPSHDMPPPAVQRADVPPSSGHTPRETLPLAPAATRAAARPALPPAHLPGHLPLLQSRRGPRNHRALLRGVGIRVGGDLQGLLPLPRRRDPRNHRALVEGLGSRNHGSWFMSRTAPGQSPATSEAPSWSTDPSSAALGVGVRGAGCSLQS